MATVCPMISEIIMELDLIEGRFPSLLDRDPRRVIPAVVRDRHSHLSLELARVDAVVEIHRGGRREWR